MARALAETGALAGLIVEQREEHMPLPPQGLSSDLEKLFIHHFQKRKDAETRFFSSSDLPRVKTLHVTKEDLNGEAVGSFLQSINPDILLSYGVHMLSEETLSVVHGEKWNIHGGLSPWYRGAITHFWPSYFLAPQMTGMTVHDLTMELDQGDVVHQNAAPLVKGDGIHDLACRAVQGLATELPKLLQVYSEKKILQKKHHRTSGRLWRSKDWHPSHLRLIYDFYNDRIVDAYLAGELEQTDPDLWRQF
ncbi:formyltransferase family protein [Kordiimonas sediminis]|nr:formyltransferase family protein [Kordiimonas sediminis]